MKNVKANFTKALDNNSTRNGALAAPVPGAIPAEVDDSGTPTSNMAAIVLNGNEKLQVLPYATGADNSTFNIQITLWSKVEAALAANDLWIPYYVGGFLCTIDAALNGVASAPLGTTEQFADTITEIATATWDDADTSKPVRVSVRSHANSHLAMITIEGADEFDIATIDFDIESGATAMNALVRQV